MMFKIGDIAKVKGRDGYYIITSAPWRIGDGLAVKIAPVPPDGLYTVEECRGCINVDCLEKIEKFNGGER